MRTMLVGVVVIALVVAACGGDDDDGDSPAATLPGGITLPDGVTIPDAMSVPEEGTIPFVTMPGGSLPDLSDPSIPDGMSIPDNAGLEEMVRDTWEQMGLDRDQIDCLLEEVDLENREIPTGDELRALFRGCDIDVSQLGGG